MSKKKDNQWDLPNTPPPPLFVGEKERNLVKQINDEILEKIVPHQIIYFPIDLETSEFHPLYGEAIEKSFIPPIKVNALVSWDTFETDTNQLMDKDIRVEVRFHKKRLIADQNLFVREGDVILFNKIFFEIVKLSEPRLLFGQPEQSFEIIAECIKARRGMFPKVELDI